MLKSSSCSSPTPRHSYFIRNINQKFFNENRIVVLLLLSTLVASIFIFLLNSSNPFNLLTRDKSSKKVHSSFHKPQNNEEERNCDLFQGNWVQDLNGSSVQYTSSSCKTIPDYRNCFSHGRKDTDFLHWSWKPERCELPSFDPKAFLEIVRGKTLTLAGDSLARNHMDSLLCLLSKEEVAQGANSKDSEDKNRLWMFPRHNFTLKLCWTRFLVEDQERIINGSGSGIFDLYLDMLDKNLIQALPASDIIIISTGHWFFRQTILHTNGSVTENGIEFAIRMAIRSALNGINQCKNCKQELVTLLRTFSPAHFENGLWNTGGTCNRTSPFGMEKIDLGSFEWQLRNIQVEEFGRAMEEKIQGKKLALLDVTKVMLMRPDGHVGDNNPKYQWMKGSSDCIHWCLPGPIDVWNDFLLSLLRS